MLQRQRQVLNFCQLLGRIYEQLSELTLLIPVSFDVPVSVGILRIVLLVASNFNLLETPLWQVNITSSKIATQHSVLKSESSCQRSDPRSVVG
jgi:hypothetical protein